MAVPQQKFRELVFQLLYSGDMEPQDEKEIRELLMRELRVTKRVVREGQVRVEAIVQKQAELDALIEKTATEYTFDRIPSVERNVLRIGLFELLFDEAIPPKVAISEGMRLSRKFSTPESSSFINAVMDSVYKQLNHSEDSLCSPVEEEAAAL